MKVLLVKYRQELVANLDPDDVLNKLVAVGAITTRQLSDIKAKNTREEKVEKLLDILAIRPDSAFDQLVESLSENQPHLSKLLRKDPSGKKRVLTRNFEKYVRRN